ncbi:MAG: hypothetical protein V8P98_01660 [Acutalibacteraceae bacterium]|jgi:hypothetical protein|nr:MAG TPA: hypothetical protein [Caudoviricetes sp.]
MSIFNDIVDKIKSNLSKNTQLSSVRFIDADRNETVPNPIKNTYVSLGIGNIFIKEAAFNSYLGLSNAGEQFGNNAEIDIEMKIFSPREIGGKQCYSIFSKIFENLLYQKKDLNIENISCGKTTYNNDIFSFELDCNIKLNAFLAYETEDININEIHVEKKA